LASHLIMSDYLLVVKKNKIFTLYTRYMISEVQKILCQGNTFMHILDTTIVQAFASTLYITSQLEVLKPACYETCCKLCIFNTLFWFLVATICKNVNCKVYSYVS
jgi:hypothetical protein